MLLDSELHPADRLRERDAEGVSLKMYAVTIFGFVCWTTYGWLARAWPVAASNAICIVVTSTLFLLRVRFGGGSG